MDRGLRGNFSNQLLVRQRKCFLMFRLIIDQLSACRWLLPVGRHGAPAAGAGRAMGSCGDGDAPFVTLPLSMWGGAQTRGEGADMAGPLGDGRSRGPGPPAHTASSQLGPERGLQL